MTVPEGYVAYHRPSGYLELIGPLYESARDPSTVRLRLDARHANARGWMHAGVVVALADTIMGHTAHRSRPDVTGLVTVSLTTDFVGSAHVGDWIEGRATVRRAGRRLAFTACEFVVGERLVLAASGVFAVIAASEP